MEMAELSTFPGLKPGMWYWFWNLSHFWHTQGNLENCRSSEGLRSFKPSRGTNLLVLIILAGDIEMNPSTDKVVKCEECRKYFHASCANLSEKELLEL